MAGEVGILNVGAGDTKLVFDQNNPQDCIRAARIVKDMLKRGHALLVKVGERDGKDMFQRATDFDESKCEYIIADFDPVAAEKADQVDAQEPADEQAAASGGDAGGTEGAKPVKLRGRRRAIPASGTRAVAVARSAGG